MAKEVGFIGREGNRWMGEGKGKQQKVDQSLPNYLRCKVGTAIEDQLSLIPGHFPWLRQREHFSVVAMKTGLTGNVALLFV